MSKILVCSNFNGRYNHTYIGHEFINIFPSDSGQWYFYVPSYGCVRRDFGKGYEPDYLVMVEYINGYYRLIGIATGLEYASDCYSRSDTAEVKNENKAHGPIKYFDKSLSVWFCLQPNTLYISYKLKENGSVYVPNEEKVTDILVSLDKDSTLNNNDIYISEKCSINIQDRKKLIGQRQRSYYEDLSGDFEIKIKDLIDKGLLRDATKDKPISSTMLKSMFEYNILDFIGKENSENVFSHWLVEYLVDIDFYNFFANKLGLKTGVKIIDAATELADSNRKRIDITIENYNELILIENKIHSSIHETKIKGKTISQLEAYYDSAQESLKDKGIKKKIHRFLLCPDYYEKYDFAGNPKLWDKSIWVPLYYSQLKGIVDDFMKTTRYLSRKPDEYIYLDEFFKALCRHAKSKPETLRERVLRQIAKRL